MGRFYSIDNDKVTVRPLLFLNSVGIALLLFFLIMPLVTWMIMLKGDIAQFEIKDLAVYLIILPLMLACIPLFILSRKRVIFDGGSRSVVIATVFRRRILMGLDDIAEITLQPALGLAYYLKHKGDRYGKGIRVSPFFTGSKHNKERQLFEQEVLPVISGLIRNNPAAKIAGSIPEHFNTGALSYYRKHFDGYSLKPSARKYMPGLIVLGLLAVFGWYRFITTSALSATDKQLAYIPSFLLLILAAVCTKRIVFDKAGQKVKVYRFGVALTTYSLDDFKGFNIVRKTHNGVYNGTDVRMTFGKDGNRRTRELTLEDFNKTTPIESFLRETEFVIGRQ